MLKFLGRAEPDKENPEGRLLTYFPGFPARDLTAEEVAVLDEATIAALISSGAYQQVGRPSTKKVEDVTLAKTPAKDEPK